MAAIELAKDSMMNRAHKLFFIQKENVYKRTDKFFAGLMIFQWLAGVLTALLISPKAWEGTISNVHIHVWAALILGGLITSFPVYLALFHSGKVITRHVIAFSQMLMSALLIHLSGGRIETHFHVFGSLAFLAFYRDWRVLITASLVVAIDHALRGLFWPQSVYGVIAVEPWRWVEHTGWVIFEDIFLALSIKQSLREMWDLAYRQAELENTNQIIEAKVVERTAELEQEVFYRREAEEELSKRALELDETNKKLVQMERLKGDFFANVSHELRTPLTLTLAPMETLLSDEVGSLNSEQKALVQTMHNNTIRLLQMVSGLLDFSKLEAGKLTVQRQATEVVALTQAIIADCQPLARQKGIELEFVSDKRQIAVELDRYLYERIVFNLLSNALKFTAQGGKISVVLKIEDDRLSLSVSDTGIGIAASDIPNLFQTFRQLEAAATRRYEGTGLGLAMVKEFSELLGGGVAVESEVGKGSTFTVELEVKPCELTTDSDQEARTAKVMVPRFKEVASSLPQVASSGSSLPKVLIAEDNESLSSYIASLLSKYCQTKIAVDGEEALEMTNQWQPDLILTDVMMPRRDGFSLCRQIKSNPSTSSIPVIILTALTHREAMLQGWQAGADEYLLKPFHPTELVTRVKTLLRNIAQHKEEMQQISELNISLEGRVIELAANNKKLENLSKQLQQARDQAVKASNYKSSFLANMSHEIRTPLNAVIGMIELLQQTPLNDQQKQLSDILKNAADVLLEVISDVLDFAKIEAGKIELNLADFDLILMVEETAELVAEKAQQKQLSLTTFVDPSLISHWRGDALRLRQVLLNFLTNAVKFTDQGEVVLRVSLEEDDIETSYIRFSVSDTGIGLSQETIQTLFQPFIQADSSVGPKYGGTGLGLSIAKLIVQLMGGKIGVESTVGQGSTFWFVVPILKSPVRAESNVPTDLVDKHILVFVGQAGATQVIKSYLVLWGMRCDVVKSASEALQALEKQANSDPYDIAICELIAAEQGASSEIVSMLSKYPSTKMIVCTIGHQKGLGEKLLSLGFAAYLPMPFRQSKLLHCLSKLVCTDKEGKDTGGYRALPASQAATVDSGTPRILVAEDNAVNQMVAKLLLKELGLAADVVKTGNEAIEAVEANNYALVLMDCQMPDTDGLEATREIRSKESFTGRHVPIVAMTAQAMQGDRERCLAAGMDDYVSKPVSLGQLREILAKYLHADSDSTMTLPSTRIG